MDHGKSGCDGARFTVGACGGYKRSGCVRDRWRGNRRPRALAFGGVATIIVVLLQSYSMATRYWPADAHRGEA
ncbi:MAG: hypothetical protein U1F54_22115 [Burkholderiales bacterium]